MPTLSARKEDLDAVSATLNRHLNECAEENRLTRAALGVVSEGLEGIEDLIRNFQKYAWRSFVGIVSIIATATVSIIAQNYNANLHRPTKAEVSGAGPTARYTVADAEKDRADRDARDAVLLDAIKKSKGH